jgi:hypothetical protein
MKIIVRSFALFSVAVMFIFLINILTLQRYMHDVINDDPRNRGIKFWIYYKWFVNPTEITYDLRKISGETSELDVNRVLFQFSEKLKDRRFNNIYLSYKGKEKFILKGDYFQNLGEDYGVENSIYTLRTLPENVYNLDGELAYWWWTGGILGVFSQQLKDLNQFAKDWYLDDTYNNFMNDMG